MKKINIPSHHHGVKYGFKAGDRVMIKGSDTPWVIEEVLMGALCRVSREPGSGVGNRNMDIARFVDLTLITEP